MGFSAVNTKALNIPIIEEAFGTEPTLKRRIYDTIGMFWNF